MTDEEKCIAPLVLINRQLAACGFTCGFDWRVEEHEGRVRFYDNTAYVATGVKKTFGNFAPDIDTKTILEIQKIARLFYDAGAESGELQIKTELRELLGL